MWDKRFFFEQYYANRKLNDIQASIKSFEKIYLNSQGNPSALQKLEQDFYRVNNTWITTLDSNGNLKSPTDFFIEVKLEGSPNNQELSNTVIRSSLYNLVDTKVAADETSPIQAGKRVAIMAIKKKAAYIPIKVQDENSGIYWGNELILKQIDDITLKYKYMNGSIALLSGTVSKIQLPDRNDASSLASTNPLFMEKIKEFQARLLLDEKKPHMAFKRTIDLTQNNVKYRLFINPIQDRRGSTVYVFSMASLQPVDEAVQMLKDYYGYLVGLTMLLILLVSFYYSKKIAQPLLQINGTTEKIAKLDFSELVPITSADEIGDLSQNINRLSRTLHSYIEKLQQDIEKEKQLEKTRKEFISSVSHELKTPLSVMKGCISILKDGVAYHKRKYYFEAMEKEIDKMDLLIVDMLELAKFESGTYSMRMDVFEIDKVLEQVCEQLSLEIKQKKLHVHLQLASVEVIANQLRIEQVITNFMTNAIRYTPERERIYIATVEEGELVKVSVENKGVQISETQLEKVWDRFYRGDTSRQRAQGGTGLGLAISKKILELHNVPYGAENTKDGVLFYFYLHKRFYPE
ncbi:HAMP domain-containing protein [Laceyella sediminis]|uniref:histidine kinase n=1 Tax=Laceyella sediminis TaxID=573074 RepID=A0ABX5EQ24_9BACL|nr:HAMP domain-containing protein [Laceyella sediminis]